MPRRRRSKAFHNAARYGAEALERRVFLSATISIADSSAIEPAPNGAVNMDFTATRTGDLTSQVTVGYTTVAGTAVANTDFTPETGTTTFASGSSTATIAIPIFNDGVYSNPGLTFSVELTGITNVVGPPVTLAAQTTFATGDKPESVTVADVNGDGKPDLIVANLDSSTVSVLLNTTAPGAAPSFASQQTFGTGTAPSSVTTADINGNGQADLIVTNSGSNSVSVLLNTTPPGATTLSFTSQQSFAAGSNPSAVTTADLNGDGKPDLIVVNQLSNTVSVLLNTTAPGATAAAFATQQIFATGGGPFSVATADLNGDGKPDLVVTNAGAGTVSVLLNTTATGATAASFASQQTFATGTGQYSVTTSDLNGDGKPDLIVANSASNTVSVLMNTTAPGATTPSFAAQQTFATGTGPFSVTAADLNGDGKPDLIVANYTSNTASVLVNTTPPGATTPSFAAQQTFATGAGPFSLMAADLNGDGQVDIIVANTGSGTLSVLRNATAAAMSTASLAAQHMFVTDGTYLFAVTTADLNGDGKPDLVIAAADSNIVSVLLNTTPPGATIPSFAAPQALGTGGKSPISVTAADLTGSGRPDIIVANYDSYTVSVLGNDTGAGATSLFFPYQQTFATGVGPYCVTVADVNGDGKPDLVVANEDGTVSVLLNTTLPGAAYPSFAAQATFAAGASPTSVTTADVNGDGKPDLIVANRSSDTASVLLNTTAPGATTPSFAAQQTFGVGSSPRCVTTADLTGDGRPDLIVANGNSGTVSVLLNTTVPGASTVSFDPQQTETVGDEPFSVTTADMNGDGRPDLIVANADSQTVSVLLNTTPGPAVASFASQQTFVTDTVPDCVTTADLNGDGIPDVIVSTESSNNDVSVLLNSPATISTSSATGTIIDPATLVINGTSGDDLITVEYDGADITYTVNGVTSSPTTLATVAGIVVNGLAGNDLITIEPGMPASLGVSVQGGPGDDTIMGGPGNDTLGGGAGNDSISGGPGDDLIKGGAGDDTLAGGKGNDTLFGSLGNDILRGGLGDDSLNGGAGTNQFYGGQGNNIFYAVNGTADQIFAGAATNDSLIYGSSDNYIIESGVIPPGNITLA